MAARKTYVAGLSVAERLDAAVMLAGHVDAHLARAQVVAVYLPIGAEMDTSPLIEYLDRRRLTIALPHVKGRTSQLRFLRWTPGDPLETGPMSLRQPEEFAPEVSPDLIFTPLLAFDARLHRLGYGAGHYDRAFAARPGARRVGLSWAMQQVALLPAEPWDVALHAVVTEAGTVTP